MMSRVRKSSAAVAFSATKIVICACCAIIVTLVIWLCISTANANNMRSNYAAARCRIGDELYGCLFNMQHEYESAGYAGADVENDILPKMSVCYSQACALDDALSVAFGAEFRVLDEPLRQKITQAFDAYDAAHKAGKSTGDADAQMLQAMAATNDRLSQKFDVNGVLLPD